MEEFVWPVVAYRPGLPGALARWAVVRLLWRLDIALAPSSRRRRLATVAKTRERLDAAVTQVTLCANWRERQRRAANLVDWALQGALSSNGQGVKNSLADELSAYEARYDPQKKNALFRTTNNLGLACPNPDACYFAVLPCGGTRYCFSVLLCGAALRCCFAVHAATQRQRWYCIRHTIACVHANAHARFLWFNPKRVLITIIDPPKKGFLLPPKPSRQGAGREPTPSYGSTSRRAPHRLLRLSSNTS